MTPELVKKDRISRFITKVRSSGFEDVHEYATFASFAFPRPAEMPAVPAHISRLFAYLGKAFIDGLPTSQSSVSTLPVETRFEVEPYDSDLVALAQVSKARGWGRNQHGIVQEYCLKNDPKTVAIELPFWRREPTSGEIVTGFSDFVRVHPNDGWKIEIPDYKPNLSRSGGLNTKLVQEISFQVSNYKGMLVESAGIPAEFIFCTAFNEWRAFKVL